MYVGLLVCLWGYVCTYACLYVCMYVCMYVCVYVFLFGYMCIYQCTGSIVFCVCVSLALCVCMHPAGAALRPPPHPLPHSAGVALPALVDVPGDATALYHVPPDLAGAVSMLSYMLLGNVAVADVLPPHHHPVSTRNSMETAPARSGGARGRATSSPGTSTTGGTATSAS